MWDSVATDYRQVFREMLAFAQADAGVTSIEYALIAALIAIVIVGSVTNVGITVMTLYETVAGRIADLF